MQTTTHKLLRELADLSPRLLGEPKTLSFLSLRKLSPYAREQENNLLHPYQYSPLGAAAQLPLYIARLSTVVSMDELPPAAAFILVEDTDSNFLTIPDVPVILCKCEGLHTNTLASRVVDSIMNTHRYDELMDLLVDALSSNKNLSHILHLCYHYFGTHLSVININYRFLAHTCTKDLVEIHGPEMEMILETGHLSPKLLASMRASGDLGRIQSSTKRLLIKIPVNNTNILVQPLVISGNWVGMLSLYDFNRPIQSDDYQILPVIGKFVSAWLQKSNQFTDSSHVPWRTFLRDLIVAPPSAEVARVQLEHLGITFPDELLVLQIIPSEQERMNRNIPLHIIHQQLNTLLLNFCWSFLLDDSVVIIANAATSGLSSIFKKIKHFLRENHLYCGCSNTFSNILELKTYYTQTTIALKFGIRCTPEYSILYYKDYMINHILSICSSSISLSTIVHPFINMLQKHDQIYHTEYLKTLSVYLSCNGNLSECSRVLNVHYNTVKYRINTIQTIGEIDLKNPDVTTMLQISLKILLQLQKTDR